MVLELDQYSDIAFLFLRLVIAAIFIYHALPKLKNASGMSQMIGMPAGMVALLGAVEFASSIGMMLDIYVQIAAFLLAMVMVGAIYFKIAKWHIPFTGINTTGWDLDLTLLAANIFLLVHGGGGIGVQ